jgi:hypothetical protein
MSTTEDLRSLAAMRDAGELTGDEYERAVQLAGLQADTAPSPAIPAAPVQSTVQSPSWSSPSPSAQPPWGGFGAGSTPLPPPAFAPPVRRGGPRMGVVLAVLAIPVIALIVHAQGAPQRALEALAADTCDELNDAIVLQVGYILGDAIDDAEELGFTGPELGDEMRAQCPAMMAAVAAIGD